MLMTTEQTAHPLFCIGDRLFESRFDGKQRLCLLLLLMLLDEQFLNLVLPVVEGGVGNPLVLAVSQHRKTAGTLIFDDLEPFL